ncbi:galactitol-1-phosphate 5-dehydrogenase [Anaerofustis stercorihominis]|uniref:galactitol-1-phosphate 5-dehydrogenase n=1 Tax=Anaerofustis stercorihominis TaxID=214853 RepID=UPI00214B7229|nr:galactitol-1-phosphate 5-dehydrogenase [Anaerofustis stercorihominis]MCR2033210.1 galactitol-1-phosphate 5-dehydrogenase [Anaerofustis stercorihominis]
MGNIVGVPEKMKALVLHDVGKLSLDEVKVPKLKKGTVLVKIKASGICSSDTERVFVNGTYHFPTIPGHEFSGQIVALGEGVDEELLGRRTCVFPMLPCKTCKACKLEEYAQCSNYNYFGSRCDGGFAEYLVVPVWNLVPFDDSVPYEKAALCEPSAVSLHAINIANIQEGQTVGVIGTGTIGFMIGLFAKRLTSKVVICGRNEEKLDFARKLGFEAINLRKSDLKEKMDEITEGEGADVMFEAVGTNAAINDAVRVTGAFGKVVLVGNPKADLSMDRNIYWSILRKQIAVLGSWNSSYNSKINDWKTALELFEDKNLPFEELITHKFKLKDYKEAFDVLIDSDEFSLKVMFTLED